jgi:hypothetical protein
MKEALHTLRNILMTRRQHGKESFVLFVDLARAFDTVEHKVLFTILGKYGVPDLIEVIHKIYANVNNLKFTIGKEK